ncbi:MAG: DNA alkylation repair protein [Patescibacteria group bacterium]
MINTAQQVKKELKALGSPQKAKDSSWFFKTGPGQYGAGDIFFGNTVPEQRKISKEYQDLSSSQIQILLNDPYHECRLTALLILVLQFKRGNNEVQKKIFNFYLKNYKYINNWDLVDTSASHIVGGYLLNKPRSILYQMVKSDNLWKKRIAIVSTLAFIQNNEFTDTLKMAKILLNDQHDLIHKSVGWMLREVGKRDQKILEFFLNQHSGQMPRTMLRYAIERFNEKKRKFYLNK